MTLTLSASDDFKASSLAAWMRFCQSSCAACTFILAALRAALAAVAAYFLSESLRARAAFCLSEKDAYCCFFLSSIDSRIAAKAAAAWDSRTRFSARALLISSASMLLAYLIAFILASDQAVSAYVMAILLLAYAV